MNIHFNNEKLFNALKANTLFKIKMGSHLYGLNTQDSDEDILYIVAESNDLSSSFLWEHHQLQYKENQADHIFTTLKGFIRNLMTGDSTINFEVLHSDEFSKSSINFLSQRKEYFYNYQIIKSYLGLARRDLKQVQDNLNFINYKKLSHAYRGLVTAKGILNKNYDNHFLNYESDFSQIKELKLNKSCQDVQSLITSLSLEIDSLREQLNLDFNAQKISRIMDVSQMREINNDLRSYCLSKDYLSKQNYVMDLNIFFEVLEKGLKY